MQAASSPAAWFIGRNHQSYGPVSYDQLWTMRLQGQLLPSDFLWTAGWTEWVPAAIVLKYRGGTLPSEVRIPPSPPGPSPSPATSTALQAPRSEPKVEPSREWFMTEAQRVRYLEEMRRNPKIKDNITDIENVVRKGGANAVSALKYVDEKRVLAQQFALMFNEHLTQLRARQLENKDKPYLDEDILISTTYSKPPKPRKSTGTLTRRDGSTVQFDDSFAAIPGVHIAGGLLALLAVGGQLLLAGALISFCLALFKGCAAIFF